MYIVISSYVQVDKKHGIDRVVKNIISHLLTQGNCYFYNIKPIYSIEGQEGYFILDSLDEKSRPDRCSQHKKLTINVIKASDVILLGLDRVLNSDILNFGILRDFKKKGVRLWFHFHDLMFYTNPEWFQSEKVTVQKSFLALLSEADGVLCVSEAVRKDLKLYLNKINKGSIPTRKYYLGSDFNNQPLSTFNPSTKVNNTNEKSSDRQNILVMVATLNQRKGHKEVLSACRTLWEHGENFKLILVGANDFASQTIVDQIHDLQRQNYPLVRYERATDTDLAKIYQISDVLLMASYAEGFGLPIVEAAQYGCHLLLRDIPVFREIGGEDAYYFSEEKSLRKGILQALEMCKKQPFVTSVKIKSWQSCAQLLCKELSY